MLAFVVRLFLASLVLFTPTIARANTALDTVDTVAADALFARVNASRREHGLHPFARCAELDAVAARFARDLVAKHYFSHTEPNGTTLPDRLAAVALAYQAAGENLALSLDPATAHRQLLASPEHRENLLDPAFGRIGISAVALRDGRTMYVEEFAD